MATMILCNSIHTTPRQRLTLVPIGHCTHFIVVSIGFFVGFGQCENIIIVAFYRPSTKLRECSVFTGVCLSTVGGYRWSHVLSGGISGTRSLLGGGGGVGMPKGVVTPSPIHGTSGRGWVCPGGAGTHPHGTSGGDMSRGYPPHWTWDTTGYGQPAGGTHPTGMLSC